MQHQNSALPVLMKLGNLVVGGLGNRFVGKDGSLTREVSIDG
jgi:hypothetical protein